MREYLFYLWLLVGFDTLIYQKRLQMIPYTCGLSGPRCRVLHYVHGSLMMGCESDRSLNPSKWCMTYGSKEDLILNVMVGFYLNYLW